MTTKERIEMVRQAIAAKKREATRAIQAGKLIEYSNLVFDLGALEQCLDIETDIALNELEQLTSKVA